MKFTSLLIPVLVVAIVITLVGMAARSPLNQPSRASAETQEPGVAEAIRQVDDWFDQHWQASHLVPASPAEDLLVLRRLSLSLHGTIPSLEEIRQFEMDARPDRLAHWTARMLADDRFADYFAERLARVFVGKEGGQFVLFRRDRFVDWLADQLRADRPYDELVREMVSNTGLWTDRPSTNFVTAALVDGEVDENKLTSRSVRAALGQRIDCAQCHDHPFDQWKQQDFEGLAAFYGQTNLSLLGVQDKSALSYEVEDRETLANRVVPDRVPFHPEWLPENGTRRERLALWITHPENRRFERATANRVWGLMFGRAWYEPVDDLPDPAEQDLLDILGGDFRENGYRLKRMIQVVAGARVFRLSSAYTTDDPHTLEQLQTQWALFPLVRLRPEQIIGAMFQASSIKTIDQNSHLFTRAARFFQEKQFVDDYGDVGENELESRTGTIPQALLRMNGKLAGDRVKANPFNATSRIAAMASTDDGCIETCFLVSLSRRPTQLERDYFVSQLSEGAATSDGTQSGSKKGATRTRVVEDLVWSLFNSPEFSWNH